MFYNKLSFMNLLVGCYIFGWLIKAAVFASSVAHNRDFLCSASSTLKNFSFFFPLLGERQKVLNWLLSYNPLWLRIGLEVFHFRDADALERIL